MTHPSRAKGNRFETQCVKDLEAKGITVKKVPLSGSLGGEYSHDLRVQSVYSTHTVECKSRKRAWSDLFGFLQKGPDFLFIKSDRTDTLVVMSLDTFAELIWPHPHEE